MKRPISLIFLVSFTSLAACSGAGTGQFGQIAEGPARSVDVSQLAAMQVNSITVDVPETLHVSESNGFKPKADIVWHGDSFGDRYQQVKDIVQEAAEQGVSDLSGPVRVNLRIEILRFHGLTPRTRYSVGGVHEIGYLFEITNSATGEIIVPEYVVNSSLDAFGGDDALAAERLGQTQKVRVINHMAAVINREMLGVAPEAVGTSPAGETPVVAGN